ncbi:MAG: hypothetical protein FRX49_08729 [Trebouxia sp. A1-2]|nr:MAG: hypothetical protein FRX49_08729 [Trebouxia sp. A1-2]
MYHATSGDANVFIRTYGPHCVCSHTLESHAYSRHPLRPKVDSNWSQLTKCTYYVVISLHNAPSLGKDQLRPSTTMQRRHALKYV